VQEAFAASQESVLADPSPSTTVVVQVAATSEVKEPDLTFIGMESHQKTILQMKRWRLFLGLVI
jgi:hypothetical protein